MCRSVQLLLIVAMYWGVGGCESSQPKGEQSSVYPKYEQPDKPEQTTIRTEKANTPEQPQSPGADTVDSTGRTAAPPAFKSGRWQFSLQFEVDADGETATTSDRYSLHIVTEANLSLSSKPPVDFYDGTMRLLIGTGEGKTKSISGGGDYWSKSNAPYVSCVNEKGSGLMYDTNSGFLYPGKNDANIIDTFPFACVRSNISGKDVALYYLHAQKVSYTCDHENKSAYANNPAAISSPAWKLIAPDKIEILNAPAQHAVGDSGERCGYLNLLSIGEFLNGWSKDPHAITSMSGTGNWLAPLLPPG